jgi:hypothetical protein
MTITLKSLKYPISLILLAFTLTGCFQSDYTKLVKSELAKGIRKDSVLLGIKLGDTRNEFYGKCFDLNKQRLVTEGPNGATVQYLFRDSLVHDSTTSLRLLFIPAFDQNDVINEMNLEFSYPAWAPWNEQYHADKLKEKVLKILMIWYKGNEFVIAKINDTDVPVKVDGNRRMLVYIKDAQNVVVKVQDILHPEFMHSISSGQAKKD